MLVIVYNGQMGVRGYRDREREKGREEWGVRSIEGMGRGERGRGKESVKMGEGEKESVLENETEANDNGEEWAWRCGC